MITIFQHGEEESAGEIGEYLKECRLPFEIARLYETNEVPVDLPTQLIILGGQMSVNDIPDYPFFANEKETIRKMVALEMPVWGICLGAQMIASAFGQPVFPSFKERGWHTIHGCLPDHVPYFPESFQVFHWHNETFNLPGGATLLSYGDNVKTQAFRLGSAIGVQFHPEITLQIISRWVKDLDSEERVRLLLNSKHSITGSRNWCRLFTDAFSRGWDF